MNLTADMCASLGQIVATLLVAVAVWVVVPPRHWRGTGWVLVSALGAVFGTVTLTLAIYGVMSGGLSGRAAEILPIMLCAQLGSFLVTVIDTAVRVERVAGNGREERGTGPGQESDDDQ